MPTMPGVPPMPALAPAHARRPRRKSTGGALPALPNMGPSPSHQVVALPQPGYVYAPAADYDRPYAAYVPAGYVNYPVAPAYSNPHHPALYLVNTPWAGPTALPPGDEPPQLHNLLAYGNRGGPGHIEWDIRNHPDTARVVWNNGRQDMLSKFDSTMAFTPGLPRIRLICKDLLPWQITVASPDGGAITINDIFNSIWKEVHRPLAESEYWACGDKERAKLTETWTKEVKSNSGKDRLNQGVLRVDWAASKTLFAGLGVDQDFIASRVQDERLHPEVWVLHLRTP
ncbi:hypothetical protein CTheo_3246 [Ceratobasidium theobromae]|uniref:DUF6699 domain-containing protein n=1 Tax=Ceratobasidium theobromae TaxID=1582974 RepID=A0A5N5QP01_9AGAM|nr:hypothetical protein CTheo_3246 [Ceratobasidium theobromae]